MRSSLIRRLRSERGFAVPTVMLAIVAAFGLGAAAIVASVTSQGGSVRDQNTKAAFAVAESGVANALLRYNRVPPASNATACAPVGAAIGAGGWCTTAVQGQLDRGAYLYRVRPTTTELQIVSTGTVDGVARRIEVVAHSAPHQPFGAFSVIGLDHINQASNSTITGNAATNGDITLASNAKLVCNQVQVGENRDVYGNYGCGPPTEGFLQLAPVNQGDVATNNDNGRITLASAGQPGGDTISGDRRRVNWNPATRQLVLDHNVSLTLGGANYSLCRLELKSNSNLFVVGGHAVRIYFDSPEACGLTSGSTQLEMDSNSSIDATGSGPGNLALLFVGSQTMETKIKLASNTQADGPCEHSFVVYAPRTSVELASNSHICGALAGKSIDTAANAKVTTGSLGAGFELPNTPPHYSTEHPGTFVECSAAPPATGPPDAGC